MDAVICDPPYGIDFQGEKWDGQAIRRSASARAGHKLSNGEAFQVWATEWAAECARVLKPGAHLVAFGAPRTAHRLASALEDAGLELRDTLMWLYGQGLPKSRRLAGGQGTALKPAYEPILLARKPPDGSIEHNHRQHGTGTLNTAACAVAEGGSSLARWPANVLLGHHPDCSPGRCTPDCPLRLVDRGAAHTRTGTRLAPVSRLFYCPKASRTEREAGCEHLPRQRLDLFPNATGKSPSPPEAANCHPTVKPLALMRWLIRLITPPGGLVLDPFCGSGSTGAAAVLERRRFLGIELDRRYHAIAHARISHWAAHATTNAPEAADTPELEDGDEAHFSSDEPEGNRPSSAGPEHEADCSVRSMNVALDPDTVESIARRVSELLRPEISNAPARLADAAAVARMLGVDRDWVYAHARELGGIRLGGARGRLRFDLRRVEGRFAGAEAARAAPSPRRRPPLRAPSAEVELLPYAEVSSTPRQSGRAARQRPRP